jgi:hypothetical protein
MAALGAGDQAVAAPGSLHAWGNPGEQRSVAHVELRPGSRGFAKGLRVAYGLAADGRVLKNGVSRNPLQASLLLEMGEVRLPGAYAALQRILGLLAHLARWRGVDRELKRRCLRQSLSAPTSQTCERRSRPCSFTPSVRRRLLPFARSSIRPSRLASSSESATVSIRCSGRPSESRQATS